MHNSMSLIPFWFYPIFIFLVLWGTKLCSPSTIKPNRLIVLPLIFFLVSTHHFMNRSDITFVNLLSLAAGMGLGGYIGYLYKRNYPIKIDRRKGLIALPADKTLLPMMLLLFGVELVMSLIEGVNPCDCWWFNPAALLISGTVSGIVAGGNYTHYYRYLHNKAPPIS